MSSELAAAEVTLQGVVWYLPVLAEKAEVPLKVALGALRLLPIKAFPPGFYHSKMVQARKLIGKRDPDEVELLALALKLRAPIWTNDRDFEGLGVEIYTTARIGEMVEEKER